MYQGRTYLKLDWCVSVVYIGGGLPNVLFHLFFLITKL